MPAVTEATPPARRRWWQRLTRRAASAVVESNPPALDNPPVPPGPPQEPERPPLLRMSPFAIGFFGTIGAMVAYGLALSVTQIKDIVIVVVVSLFLALGLNPIVEFFVRRGLKRWVAVLIVGLALLSILGLGSWALIPVLLGQIDTLTRNAPGYVQQVLQNNTVASLNHQFHFVEKTREFLSKPDAWTNLFGGLFGAGKALFNAFVSTIITIVLTLYFLSSLPQIKNVIYQLSPKTRRPRMKYLANEIFRRIGGYLSGMFVVVTCAALCAFVMMQFVGLRDYSLALAFVVAIFAFIPLVGSMCSMTIVSLVALSVSPVNALIVVIYFLVYMQIDAYLIQPRIMSRSVSVPGAIVVVAALAGGALLGIVGALIAIPSAAALLILYREVVLPRLEQS